MLHLRRLVLACVIAGVIVPWVGRSAEAQQTPDGPDRPQQVTIGPPPAQRQPIEFDPPFPATCGNGVLDSDEVCEGPGIGGTCGPGLVCRFDCQGCEPVCGDGTFGPGEVCEAPGSAMTCAPGLVCGLTCEACTPCGNGIIDVGEACDPPFQRGECAAGEICRGDCTKCDSICGDGLMAAGEVCDPPGSTGNCTGGSVCSPRCGACLTCGNGVLDSGEVCDPPFAQGECAAGETCRADCTGCETTCGDLVRGPSEACDPPGVQGGCGDVEQICAPDCGSCLRCGNARIDPGEVCDPRAAATGCIAGQACRADCSACDTICGDGLVVSGEVCDQAETVVGCGPGEVCGDCRACAACGNGFIDAGEACDPPGEQGLCSTGTACALDCSGCENNCGDGIVSAGEACDPPGEEDVCGTGAVCAADCRSCASCSTPLRAGLAVSKPPPASRPKRDRGRATTAAARTTVAPAAGCGEEPLPPCTRILRDPAKPYCGRDLTSRLVSTINDVIDGFAIQKERAGKVAIRLACNDLIGQARKWDIVGMVQDEVSYNGGYACGSTLLGGTGFECAEVCGSKQWVWDINYVMWGLMNALCNNSIDAAAGLAITYKVASEKKQEVSDQLAFWFETGVAIGKSGHYVDETTLCGYTKKLLLTPKGKFVKGDYSGIDMCPIQFPAEALTSSFAWETWMVTSTLIKDNLRIRDPNLQRRSAMFKRDQAWLDGLKLVIDAMPWCNLKDAPCESNLLPLLEQYQIVAAELRTNGKISGTLQGHMKTRFGADFNNVDPWVKTLCNLKQKAQSKTPANPNDFGKRCVCQCREGGISVTNRTDAPGQNCSNLATKPCDDRYGGAGKAFGCWGL